MSPAQFAAAWEDQQLGGALGYLFLALAVIGFLCQWLDRRRAQASAPDYLSARRAAWAVRPPLCAHGYHIFETGHGAVCKCGQHLDPAAPTWKETR